VHLSLHILLLAVLITLVILLVRLHDVVLSKHVAQLTNVCVVCQLGQHRLALPFAVVRLALRVEEVRGNILVLKLFRMSIRPQRQHHLPWTRPTASGAGVVAIYCKSVELLIRKEGDHVSRLHHQLKDLCYGFSLCSQTRRCRSIAPHSCLHQGEV
jgi:hypothetical protein